MEDFNNFTNTSSLKQSLNSPSDNNVTNFSAENFKSSTPISAKNSMKTKNDSAYSSFVSQKAHVMMNSNPSSQNYESPGTSYSSRNSALVNDDEMEELFRGTDSLEIETEKVGSISFFLSDTFFRRSARNSPWTVRPDSAPLNEEEEDSDKEASNYLCNFQGNCSNVNGLPEIVQSTLHRTTRARHISMTDAEQRNEIIASKLKQIADKLPTMRRKKVRHKSCIFNSENSSSSSTKRHSFSSFAEMMPNGMGSTLDLFVSLYNIYKQHSNKCPNKCFSNSQSMQNMENSRQRLNRRNRSYTD